MFVYLRITKGRVLLGSEAEKTVRMKHSHEIRDPVHVFIHLDSDERKVLDSPYVQRLRHIHQLSLGYLVYPGATHRRPEPGQIVFEAAKKQFGENFVRHDTYVEKGAPLDFPIQYSNGEVISSHAASGVIRNIPPAAVDYVFIAPEKQDEALKWRENNLNRILEEFYLGKGVDKPCSLA